MADEYERHLLSACWALREDITVRKWQMNERMNNNKTNNRNFLGLKHMEKGRENAQVSSVLVFIK